MKAEDENRALWRDALGDRADDFWHAFPRELAPPLSVRFVASPERRRWRLVAAAALAVVGLMAGWNLKLSRELSDARRDHAFAMLGIDSWPARLTALSMLRGETLSSAAVTTLMRVVATSRDPNVQLAALDLLIDSGAIDVDDLTHTLLEQIRHNRAFVETSLRARTTRI